MPQPNKPKKFYTGVSLDPDVVNYLEVLRGQVDRPRTWLVNTIIRQHIEAQRNLPVGAGNDRLPQIS